MNANSGVNSPNQISRCAHPNQLRSPSLTNHLPNHSPSPGGEGRGEGGRILFVQRLILPLLEFWNFSFSAFLKTAPHPTPRRSFPADLRPLISGLWLFFLLAQTTTAEQQFTAGVTAYRAGDFSRATAAFRASVADRPAAGTYRNLGNAQWQQGRTGPAIRAWEQALWLSPSDAAAANNLQFARSLGQLDAPELTWYEVISTWLPSGWWALVTTLSLWLVTDLLALPGIFRRRRTGWQQALAALGLTLFLLSLPAHIGWHTRAQIGIVLESDTPLRLTPTESAQEITRVGAGEPGRCERTHGNYCYIRFRNTAGWLTHEEFGLISTP